MDIHHHYTIFISTSCLDTPFSSFYLYPLSRISWDLGRINFLAEKHGNYSHLVYIKYMNYVYTVLCRRRLVKRCERTCGAEERKCHTKSNMAIIDDVQMISLWTCDFLHLIPWKIYYTSCFLKIALTQGQAARKMTPKLIIYGATSFTAQNLLPYLESHPDSGDFDFILAGRNRQKLDAVNRKLNQPRTVIVCDLTDDDAVEKMVTQGKVVVNLAGPYQSHNGEALVR